MIPTKTHPAAWTIPLLAILSLAAAGAGPTTAPASGEANQTVLILIRPTILIHPEGVDGVNPWPGEANVQPAGGRFPLAVVLQEPKGIGALLGSTFPRKQWGILSVALPKEADEWAPGDAQLIAGEIDSRRNEIWLDANRAVLVAGPHGGPAALEFINRFPNKIAAAVLVGVKPVASGAAGGLWTPNKEAWKVPIWAVTGTEGNEAIDTLRMWRRVAAAAPKDAGLTIDTRLVKEGNAIEPDAAIGKWLEAVAAGKRPALGPDRQLEEEKHHYALPAEALRKVAKSAVAGQVGLHLAKRQAPISLSVGPPRNWGRDPRNERDYSADANPYVQIYLKPAAPGTLLFARVMGTKAAAKPADALEEYDRRLAARGYLIVRHSQWEAASQAWEITSVLWPAEGRWHRWLALSGAGPAQDGASPLVSVLDSALRPNTSAMAPAAKTLLDTVRLAWIGTATTTSRNAGDNRKEPQKKGG